MSGRALAWNSNTSDGLRINPYNLSTSHSRNEPVMDKTIRQQALRAGADRAMAKNYDPVVFLPVIRGMLAERRGEAVAAASFL